MPAPVFFTPDFIQFYKDLAANNNRDWFQDNKKRYEQSVKQPFSDFVQELILQVKKHDSALDLEPKDAIFRINRDIRFSKDKTPYKLCSSAIVARGGKKDHVSPGLYIELGPEKVAVYGGVYMPDKQQLTAIRSHIVKNMGKFSQMLNDEAFTAAYGTLHGEKNKILPKELKEAGELQPLLYNKAFYYYSHMKPETMLNADFITLVMNRYEAGRPMSDFLFSALSKNA